MKCVTCKNDAGGNAAGDDYLQCDKCDSDPKKKLTGKQLEAAQKKHPRTTW